MNERILPEAWIKNGWTIPRDEDDDDEEAGKLGEGAYGVVYKVEKQSGPIKTEGAVKIIRIPQKDAYMKDLILTAGSEKAVTGLLKEMVDQFAAEIETMYNLRGSAHIVSLLDHDIHENEDHRSWKICILMEYLTPFVDYHTTTKLTEADVLHLGMDIADALVKCAKHNILHRDIKPENIFVTKDGDFKLGDFGVARLAESTNGSMSAKGTAMYMAPELVRMSNYDTRADQYSLGIVLYRLMNDYRLPFVDPSQRVVSFKLQNEALERRMKGETLPPPINASKAFAQVILKACAYNPDERYPDSKALFDALKEVAEGKVVIEEDEPVKAEEPDNGTATETATETAPSEPGKKSGKSKIVAALVGLVAVIGAFAGWKEFGPNDAPTETTQVETTAPETQKETTAQTETQAQTAAQTETQAQTAAQTETTAPETTAQTETQAESETQAQTETETQAPKKNYDVNTSFSWDMLPYTPVLDEAELKWNLPANEDADLFLRNVTEIGKTADGVLVSVVDYRTSKKLEEPADSGSTVLHDSKIMLVSEDFSSIEEVTGDTEITALDESLKLNRVLPEAYANAIEEDKVAYSHEFDVQNAMYINRLAVFKGVQTKMAKFLWADENGEVFMSVWICNGSDDSWRVNNIAGELRNGDKKIVSFSADGGITVPSKNGSLVTFSLGEIKDKLPKDGDGLKVVFD